jgi:hypothetical protein
MARSMNDIGLNENEDLDISTGDFSIVESTAIHQQQLILNNKGDFKQNPTICVNAASYFDDENFQGLVRAISVEFTRDGMDVAEVSLKKNAGIKTSATYE